MLIASALHLSSYTLYFYNNLAQGEFTMTIQLNKNSVIIGAVVLIVLVLGVAGVLPAFSQAAENGRHGEDTAVSSSALATVDESITYQGRLTDNDGNPLHGDHTMRFFLYNAPSGGTALFDSGNLNVNVSDGLFTISLPIPQNQFDGQALWLAIDVEGQTLSPRQAIRPAPYAMSLRPGAEVVQAATGTAVRVESAQGIGLHGTGQVYGLYGSNSGPGPGWGYGGYFESDTGTGVFGSTTAVPTTTNRLPAGVSGYSENGAGVYGEAGQFAWAGYFNGHVRIDGSVVISDSLFANDKSGYLFDIAFNDDTQPLSHGDVVVVTGVTGESVIGNIPVFTVRRATEAESPAVVGVVDRRYVSDENNRGRMEDSPAAPGEYVGIVTVGAFQAVKVDATYGAIQPGDLLVSSPTPGHAMRAHNPATGTVIGKALSPLDSGTGTVAVMVTLQ
jgi:hypothetical protein